MLRAMFAAVALALALAGAARAQGPPGFGGPPPGGPPPFGPALMRLLPPPGRWSELGLSDDQQDRIEALHDDEVRATVRAEADARLAELDLARALEKGDTGTDALVDRVAAARAQMLAAHVRMIRAARRVLTGEQLRKLARMGPADPGRDGMRGGPRGDAPRLRSRGD